jgi:hypothetical protein
MFDDRNILNQIRTLCADGESGRLEVLAGAIQGELTFAGGKLVDARFGHLTGFRAVNALAAIQDARVSFDPTFAPLGSSSITGSERVVLKQFFGIETATAAYFEPVTANWPEEEIPVAAAPPVADAPEEVTIVRDNVTSAEISNPLPRASRFSYRIPALTFAALALALLTAAAVFIYRAREHSSPAVVAGTEASARPEPVPAQPSESVAVNSTPAHAVPAAAPVKREQKHVNVAENLSGKWNIVNTVETTSYRSYKDLKIGFAVSLDQNGTSFTGKGYKVSENGRSLPSVSRTPIQVKGSINGDRIEATFFEEGTLRKTNGRFVWRMDKQGRGLNGTFATTAARSRGKSAAVRL